MVVQGKEKGLYEPRREHDACGIGAVVNISGQRNHSIIEYGKQVLLNLVKNAIEAMEKGGNLSIQSQLHDDKAEISITDDGPGIPESAKDKILTPFFTTKKQGTGLGLCVSKRIIEDHPDSSFSVKSQKGKGTVVTIGMALSIGSDRQRS